MKTSSLANLALQDPGQSTARTFPLLFGLIFGIATWIVLTGFARGAGEWLKERVGGSVPNRIRVSSARTQLGPLQLGGNLNEEHVQACAKIPGVVTVYRQAHYPGPCQLFASHMGETLVTDMVLEGVDPEQVTPQIPDATRFVDTTSGDLPVVLPQAVLDVINAGISAHTNLPNLNEQALLGKHFRVRIGSSSFAPGPSFDVRCVVVGVSDQLGVNGPAVPLEWVLRNSKKKVEYHTLTLELSPNTDLAAVLNRLEALSLAAPDLGTMRKIGQATFYLQLLASAFAGAILMVAGVGIASGFNVKVQLERQDIGLYRSLGATRSDILKVYLLRALWLGLQGSLLGLVVGLAAGFSLQAIVGSGLPMAVGNFQLFRPGLANLLIPLGFAPLVALAAAWFPAHEASRLDPGRILRGA